MISQSNLHDRLLFRVEVRDNGGMKLLTVAQLELSCVVANNRMNRERVATGSNGYESEIGFDPIEFLVQRYEACGQVRWLDLCCGRGKALIETAARFAELGLTANSCFVGVDLVNMFDEIPASLDFVEFECSSLHQWQTSLRYDLITCVHGIHYVADKLDLILRAAGWLEAGGRFRCSLDLANLGHAKQASFDFEGFLERFGFEFHQGAHLLSIDGGESNLPDWNGQFVFVGADENAGPNYSGQEAVNSYYRFE